MIGEPVVFILGAGASMPYGYPSGFDLTQSMLQVQQEIHHVLVSLGRAGDMLAAFQSALRNSASSSVDAFLANRAEFLEIGRLLIAATIMNCEYEGQLFTPHNKLDRWYPKLLNVLDGDFDSLDFSNVTIVTFNYDRSLEHFLFTALWNRHGTAPEEMAELLSKLRVIHVYGHVGLLDWQDAAAGRTYRYDLSSPLVKKASEGIKIIAEGRDDSPELIEARQKIEQASAIFLLGTGYHPDNMRRLGFPLVAKSRWVKGSSYGLTRPEIDRFENLYRI